MRRARLHRGLTLIEVLASLVIVALLAGVCVPMLQQAAGVMSEAAAADDSPLRLDLEAMADAFGADPASFGVGDVDAFSATEITSADFETIGSVSVERLQVPIAEEEGTFGHDWLVFRRGGLLALRLHPLPPQPEQDASP
jgi:prepilin-type N-terminal cleavage/methylation domain-containing protein